MASSAVHKDAAAVAIGVTLWNRDDDRNAPILNPVGASPLAALENYLTDRQGSATPPNYRQFFYSVILAWVIGYRLKKGPRMAGNR